MRVKFMMLLALALWSGACRQQAEVPAPVAVEPAPSAPSPPAARPARDLLPRERIYYDLTRFDWYAHGEPLRHEGMSYQPGGLPIAADAHDMQQLGDYQGVDYYRHADGDGRIFVPVADGYWLAFLPVRAAVVPAD
jgi:hypothetical protein